MNAPRTSADTLRLVPLWLFLLGMNVKVLYDVLMAMQVVVYGGIEYFAFGCLAASGLASLVLGRLADLRSVYQLWLIWLGLLLFGLCLYGWQAGYTTYTLSRDLFALCYLSGIFVGADRRNWPSLDRMVMLHFAAIAGLCWMQVLLLGRSLAYQNIMEIVATPYYLLWGLLYPWEYFLASAREGRFIRKVVVLGGVGMFALLSIALERRTAVVTIAIVAGACLATGLWRSAAAGRLRRQGVVLSAAMVLIALTLGGLTWRLQGDAAVTHWHNLARRFVVKGGVVATLRSNYRWTYEVDQVVGRATAGNLIFGQGVGAAVRVPYVAAASGRSGTLHNGVMNIVLKGGFLLLATGLLGGLLLLLDAVRTDDRHARICAVVILTAAAIAPVQTFLNTGPAWGLRMACAGYLMARCVPIRRGARVRARREATGGRQETGTAPAPGFSP